MCLLRLSVCSLGLLQTPLVLNLPYKYSQEAAWENMKKTWYLCFPPAEGKTWLGFVGAWGETSAEQAGAEPSLAVPEHSGAPVPLPGTLMGYVFSGHRLGLALLSPVNTGKRVPPRSISVIKGGVLKKCPRTLWFVFNQDAKGVSIIFIATL